MVTTMAVAAGLPERLYFNIEKVGNVSAASIPLAIYDAVREGVIDRPMRLFTPVGPARWAATRSSASTRPSSSPSRAEQAEPMPVPQQHAASSSEDVRAAFGG
jgi:3-oxoacyl-[acyl-carrier-protein] synthase III